MRFISLAILGLALLLVATPARAATPHAEVTFFSDFGHSIGDGYDWRWTSDDETLTTSLYGNSLSVTVGGMDDEIKHGLLFSTEPGTPFRTGRWRVPRGLGPYGVPGLGVVTVSALYGSTSLGCPYWASGAFEVRELEVADDGTVERAWILYEQRCQRYSYGAFGEVRIGMPRREPLATQPTVLRFPSYDAGHEPKAVPVQVRATQPVTATRVVGDNASAFEIEQDACSGKGLGDCDVRVRYTAPAPGTHRAVLDVQDARGEHTRVPLQGFSYGGETSLVITRDREENVNVGPEADYYFDSQLPRDLTGWVGVRLWGFRMSMPGSTPFTTGDFPHAVSDSDTLPVVCVSYHRWSCTPSEGSFTVDEFVRGEREEVRSFAFRFAQRPTTPYSEIGSLQGTLKYRSGDTTPEAPWLQTSPEVTDLEPTPTPTPTPTPDPTATATPEPTSTSTASPESATPAPTATQVPATTPVPFPGGPLSEAPPLLSAALLRDRAAPRLTVQAVARGVRVTLSEPAAVTTTLRWGRRTVRRAFGLEAGRHTLTARRLSGRARLARGRYTLTVRVRDAAGNVAPAQVLRFKV